MNLVIEQARVADLFGTYHERGYVVIEDGRIEAVGEGPGPDVPGAQRLDAQNMLLTPGLVNAHAHLYSSLARGISLPNYSPKSFGDILEGLWLSLIHI